MESKYNRGILLMLSQSLIGTGFFFLYVHHVRSIYESRTNIAHLNQLERESLLRREDALYYSFYKTLTEETNFWDGYEKLKNVTSIEYPNSVNVLQRFHVLPELAIAYVYHQVKLFGGNGILLYLSCWRTSDIHLPFEQRRCDTASQPMQFYLEVVWFLGGFTILTIFMYGALLSENIFGGIYTVLSYVMFHSFVAKIYERPMARENFAGPVLFLQMFVLCAYIDQVTPRRSLSSRIIVIFRLTILNAIALLCWQFSAIVFATQILIMMTPWSLNVAVNSVVSSFTIDYTISHMLGNLIAYYFSYGNKKYAFAWQMGPMIGLFFISIVRRMKPHIRDNEFSLKTVFLGILMAISAQGTIIDLLEKSGLARSIDNTFALYRDLLIHWGLQAKVNFSTSLAACNPDYNSMAWVDLWELFKTLIVKPYCLYGVVMLAKFFRKWRKSSEIVTPNSEYIERAKKYVLEDFLEENLISMRDMSNKETENELNQWLKILEACDYDYERYKSEKTKMKKEKPNEHQNFMNDVKKLKEQINELNEKKQKERENAEIFKQKIIEEQLQEQPQQQQEQEQPATPHNEKEQENLEENQHKQSLQQQEQDKASTTETMKTKPSKSENIKNDTNTNGSRRNVRHIKSNSKRGGLNSQTNASIYASAGFYDHDFLSFHYIYSFIQMAVFTIIGLSIKKLFFLSFTQGCVIAPTICSKFWYRKQRNIFWTVSLAVFLTSIFDPGLMNVREEYFPTRYKNVNDDLDTMLEWIKMNTEKDAVFAGPIDIIGTVHLATRRPIVNHAHLEMRHISDRIEHVYSVFSRQQSSDIYNQYSQLKIQYLIISMNDCLNEVNDECDLLSIWDDIQPAYRKFPQFCSELTNKNVPSFLKVFSNDFYGIIKMFSQSVQINIKYSKMAEKVM